MIDGKEVILLPFEDQPEQRGTILGVSGSDTAIVRLNADEYDPCLDDGLREVPLDQVVIL